jgi:hypothetical protein
MVDVTGVFDGEHPSTSGGREFVRSPPLANVVVGRTCSRNEAA